MRKRMFHQRVQSVVSFLLILILLPYIVTVFIHGSQLQVSGQAMDSVVEVKIAAEDGSAETKMVPWEEFFLGALACEIPENSEPEFIKAQAVLLRTNLYRTLENGGSVENVENFESVEHAENGDSVENSDSVENVENSGSVENSGKGKMPVLEEPFLTKEELEKKCMNLSDSEYYAKLKQAMKETSQEVLFYEDSYAIVPFHQSSNGATRNYKEVTGQENCPYIVLRECPLDKEAKEEQQELILEYKEVQKKCQSFLVAVAESDAGKVYQFSDFEILSYDSAGYVSELRIGETQIGGDQFRDALSLPSSSFSLADDNGRLKVTTMGKGHGLGMSQWTANEMAKEGKTYQEILRFFYEGTNLTKKTVGLENQ